MITNSSIEAAYQARQLKNLVLVSHSLDEAITRSVLNHRKSLKAAITIISLQEWMSEYEVFDELGDTGTSIQWMKGTEHRISNASHLLLNRVLYVPSHLFSNFTKKDREYAQREFEAYLGFAFNAFTGVGNRLANGACVESISLPQQWNRIAKEKALKIKIPKYYWGPYRDNHLENKDNVVYSKIFNFLQWSRSQNPIEEKQVFCFEKPRGQPLFVLSIGRAQLITFDGGLSQELKDKIALLVERIQSVFDYFISEILLFMDGPHIHFGCINPDIVRSDKNEHFDSFVCNHLLSEFYQCIRN